MSWKIRGLLMVVLLPLFGMAAEAQRPRIKHIVVGTDVSGSTDAPCENLKTVIRTILAQPYGTGSTITTLFIGGNTTASEPRLGSVYQLPTRDRVFGSDSDTADKRLQILRSVELDCGRAGRTLISPVFNLISEAVTQVSDQLCNAKYNCRVVVVTDGEETEDPMVKRALRTGHVIGR